VIERAWWAQWSTEFLFWWLWDFKERPKDLTPARSEDREFILDRLVEGGFARPKEGDEERQFSAVWRRFNGGTSAKAKSANRLPPTHYSAVVASSAVAAAAAAQGSVPRDPPERKSNGGGPARDVEVPAAAAMAPPPAAPVVPQVAVAPAPLVLPMQRGRVPQRPEESDDAFEDECVGMDECEKQFAVMPSYSPPVQRAVQFVSMAPPPPKAPAAAGVAVPLVEECMTCLLPKPDPTKARWICAGCSLRGDEPAGTATNLYMAKLKEAAKAGAKEPDGSSASSSSAGQSLAQGQAANRLERELRHLASGEPHPLFMGPESTAPLSGKEALSIVRKALGASATESPSPELVKLVTRGLLVHPGYCVPRLLARVQDKDSSLMLANGSEIPIQASGSGPPKIASLHAFMSSCVNVIFPLLMGQPAALAQWFALAASGSLRPRRTGPTRMNT
jgi:hypothetical protein